MTKGTFFTFLVLTKIQLMIKQMWSANLFQMSIHSTSKSRAMQVMNKLLEKQLKGTRNWVLSVNTIHHPLNLKHILSETLQEGLEIHMDLLHMGKKQLDE